jgi:geranylgeranyl diphosphate synthase type I
MTTGLSASLPASSSAPNPGAGEVLAACRDLVDPALRDAVDTLPASVRDIAAYHFGWLDEHGAPTEPGTGAGKALRPALVLLAARAVGSRPDPAADAVAGAAAVELVHNFSLIHDDVIDGDVTRRHRRTAWHVFGVNAAILAGDSLLTLALDVLAANGGPQALAALRTLSGAVQALVDGQCADIEFERRDFVGMAECLAMAESKTGSLMGAACAIGALFGGARPAQVVQLRAFGERLGLAFQFTDDLLGIWGRADRTGKPVYADLRRRKKSLLVVDALGSGTPAGAALAELYRADGELSDADVARAAELIEESGARQRCQEQVRQLLAQSLRRLNSAGPADRPAADLAELAHLVTTRDH